MRGLQLGLLPAAGGGLASLAATGQDRRLTDCYFPAYLETFHRLLYFSYHAESLDCYVKDSAILEAVSLVPRLRQSPYRLYAFQLPFAAREQLRACAVLRVFQTTGAVPAIIARLLYGIPFVVTYGYRYHAFASIEGRHVSSVYLRVLEAAALRLAAGVIVTTQELASYVSRAVPTARVHVIPNGVDIALFAPSARDHGDRKDVTSLLFVGRLTRQKNLSRLLEALAVLAPTHPIRLQIIGEGPLRQELEAEASRLGIDCVFEGIVPNHALPDHMNEADLFVLPSLIEGHPKVLIEAMSCGMPCVVSACEGNRAVVEHERTGLLFDPTDIMDIVAQLGRVIRNKSLARSLGQAARVKACAEYDLRLLLRRETGLLHAVAEQASARHRG